MRILVNGSGHDTASVDLSALLNELGYGNDVVATAVNGEFVPRALRADARLAEGDRIEVVAPMQGG